MKELQKEECMICLSDFDLGTADIILKTPCSHYFH